MSDLATSQSTNLYAKASTPNNVADVKAALARLNDSEPIYDQMIRERKGNSNA